MDFFGGYGNHFQSNKNKKKLIFSIVLLVALVALLISLCISLFSNNDSKDRDDNEEPPKSTTVIQNDPHLGTIEIEYYDDMEKNEYKRENFSIDDNGFVIYSENGVKKSYTGLDLSEFQGDIDFYAVKASGVDFVMLKLGGRGYGEEGTLYPDGRFSQYYEQAKAAGLKVGAYFFSQAITVEEAKEEANYALYLLDNMPLDYPIAFDWELMLNEPNARTNGLSKKMLSDCTVAFCETIKMAGYTPMIYSNTSLTYTNQEIEKIKGYDFWHAEYTDSPSLFYNFTIWQYSDHGYVDGINTPVDLNICFKDY